MKKNLLDNLKNAFLKKSVLEIHDVINLVNATSRMTAYRYLKKLDYLSSYTHARQFYTLKNIPEFDRDGLWYFGDIGFSKHGTLMETIVHLINHSKNGKTSSDLKKQQHVYVQNALLSLVKDKKISREQQDGVYVYFSTDSETSRKQMEKRNEKGCRKQLPEWIVAEILIEIIRSLTGIPDIDEVATRLSKRGSLITRAQVEQVFEEHDLEKKTPD
ncbi:MAG: hypothetical protein K2W94_07550 [Alphaproteobacteria bacterium]|nr:hypothetical protein [Alphaproteobacteria bacterium]